MKKHVILALFVATPLFSTVFAEGLIGTWRGELAVSPESTIVVEFVIDQTEEGSYSAVLNAPEETSLRDIPVTTLAFDNGRLKMEVAEVNGTYDGILENRSITGTWSQQKVSFPLNLMPYSPPKLSEEMRDLLVGEWVGRLTPPNMPDGLTIVFRFEPGEDGGIKAFLDSPEQGAFGIEVTRFTVDEKEVKLRITEPTKILYLASIDGESMSGEFRQRDSMPLTLTKGQYRVAALDLPSAARERLTGSWHGQIQKSITVVLRFGEEQDGRYVGVLDSLDQGRTNLPVSDVRLDGDVLSLHVPGIGASMEARISDREMAGDYRQDGQTFPISLRRGEYVAHRMELPDAVIEQLLGEWEAKTANTTFIFRFEGREDGESFAYLDIPSERLMGLPITEMRVDGDSMDMIVRGIGAEFSGEFAATEISGEWTMPDLQFPIVITKTAN
jgi:hypothetical protein